ncbi:hypothetical protein WBG83_16880 [Paenibacillus sp. y28]
MTAINKNGGEHSPPRKPLTNVRTCREAVVYCAVINETTFRRHLQLTCCSTRAPEMDVTSGSIYDRMASAIDSHAKTCISGSLARFTGALQ